MSSFVYGPAFACLLLQLSSLREESGHVKGDYSNSSLVLIWSAASARAAWAEPST